MNQRQLKHWRPGAYIGCGYATNYFLRDVEYFLEPRMYDNATLFCIYFSRIWMSREFIDHDTEGAPTWNFVPNISSNSETVASMRESLFFNRVIDSDLYLGLLQYRAR